MSQRAVGRCPRLLVRPSSVHLLSNGVRQPAASAQPRVGAGNVSVRARVSRHTVQQQLHMTAAAAATSASPFAFVRPSGDSGGADASSSLTTAVARSEFTLRETSPLVPLTAPKSLRG